MLNVPIDCCVVGLITVFPAFPPEDQKVVIAVESLVMRLAGMPLNIAKLELVKFEDSVQYWYGHFLTLNHIGFSPFPRQMSINTSVSVCKRNLLGDRSQLKKVMCWHIFTPFLKEEVIEASKVEYKLSDIQLPPEKPQPPPLCTTKFECKKEPTDTTLVKPEEKPAVRKRKSRWDKEEPVKRENGGEMTQEEVLASAIAAAKVAAQLAASGTCLYFNALICVFMTLPSAEKTASGFSTTDFFRIKLSNLTHILTCVKSKQFGLRG